VTNIFNNDAKLFDYDILLIDVYGVIKGGNGLIQGVEERLESLVKAGIKVIILSNATQRTSDSIKSFAKMGLQKDVHFHDYITSGEMAFEMISNGELFNKEGYTKFCQFGIPRKDLFENSKYQETDINEAEFFYISTPMIGAEAYKKQKPELKENLFLSRINAEEDKYDSTIIDPFIPELKEISKHKLPAFCANPDYIANETAKTGEINFVIRQGGTAKAYKDLGGEVTEVGKPYSEIYDYAYNLLERKYGISKEELKTKKIAMIGDTIRTDIQGAINSTNELGIKVDSFLTLTGVSAKDIDKDIIDRGDDTEIRKSLNSDKPTYIIKSFGL